ncbi:MAG: ADP-ribosylation factor-like protein [Candidatus Hodarchaeota archaeon]
MEKDVPKSEKRIPIAIVGLENAGKTTLAKRIQTGKFIRTITPTTGLDIESVELKGNLFQLFDLGGQIAFRELFWQTYVQLSHGIIFVIDSSDTEKLDHVVEWFWKCLKWNPTAPLLILANKSDLVHIELNELITKIKLDQIPKQSSQRSFRIFEVSTKTGANIKEALGWFSEKLIPLLEQKTVRLIGLYLYLPTGIPIASHRFTSKKIEDFDEDMVPGFLHALDQFASGVIGASEGLNSITTEQGRIMTVKREGVMCAIVTDKESDPITARVIAESFLNYVEATFSQDLSLFRRKGKLHFPKNLILEFLKQEFAQNIIF